MATIGQRVDDLTDRVDSLESWRDQTLGASKEAAKQVGRLFAIAGIALTLINVAISLYVAKSHHGNSSPTIPAQVAKGK
jgi:hypothetical protein